MARRGRPGVPVFELGEAAEDAAGAAPGAAARAPASPHASAVRDFEGVFDLVAGGLAPRAAAPEPPAPGERPGARGQRGPRAAGPSPARPRRPSPARPAGALARHAAKLKLLLPLCPLCLVLAAVFASLRHAPASSGGQRSGLFVPLSLTDLVSEDRLSAVLPVIIVGGGFFCMVLGASVASCVWWLVQQERRTREAADHALREETAPREDSGRELFSLNEFVQQLQSKLGLTVTEEQLGRACASLRKNRRGAISATALLQECLSTYGEELRARRP